MVDIVYSTETWETFYPDFLPVWYATHQAETDTVAPTLVDVFDFDATRYALLEEQNALTITTARENEKLIGYVVSIRTTHLHHYKLTTASPSLYYVLSEYRRRCIGSTLFRYTQDVLKAQGVMLFIVGAKTYLPYQVVFEHLGFHAIETVFIKRIDTV
jgi:GNAT superfamily N-acetyltransferase